jgi:hypothetical protein
MPDFDEAWRSTITPVSFYGRQEDSKQRVAAAKEEKGSSWIEASGMLRECSLGREIVVLEEKRRRGRLVCQHRRFRF